MLNRPLWSEGSACEDVQRLQGGVEASVVTCRGKLRQRILCSQAPSPGCCSNIHDTNKCKRTGMVKEEDGRSGRRWKRGGRRRQKRSKEWGAKSWERRPPSPHTPAGHVRPIKRREYVSLGSGRTKAHASAYSGCLSPLLSLINIVT